MLLQKPTPGMPASKTPLASAAFVGDLLDIRNAHLPLGDAPPSAFLSAPTDLVKIKNLTGADRVRGAVVQLGNGLLDAVNFRALWLQGNAVAYPACTRYAILREPIKSNQIGDAQASGVCVARVNVTDDGHRYAMPTEGAYVLSSCAIGPIELLSQVVGETEQDMIVRLCANPGFTWAVTAEEIPARSLTACGEGEVTFWVMGETGGLSATSMSEDAENWTGGVISSGTLVRVARDEGGALVFIGADCSEGPLS